MKKNYLSTFFDFSQKHWIAILVLISPILIYIINFGCFDISDNPENWAWFGDYIGGVYSVILAFVILYLTRQLEKKDKLIDKRKEHLEKIYTMISKIEVTKTISANSGNKILRQIVKSRLYISSDLYLRIEQFANHIIACSNNKEFDISLRNNVLEEINNEYNRQ